VILLSYIALANKYAIFIERGDADFAVVPEVPEREIRVGERGLFLDRKNISC
jgi:hypothetical protein